ncbi:RnfABCDGE type electron transport complex subunit D [Candidatus Woesearchaeota archaeon]|nr:RnfABCDGE type electron transport complex subunit D [Candidatus Woesearchaeota archaeon]
MIFFLAVLSLVSSVFYGFGFKALLQVLISITTTVTLDLFIEYFKSKTWLFPQSALISGLFIGGLLTQNLQWYIYVIAGIVAVLSKHLIKIQQKHIFNPANLGVLLVSIIFGVSHTWWISSPLILVLIFGILAVWKLRRLDLTISFLISYYFISSIIELAQGTGYREIYFTIINGGVIYFFSMYMLIEPKTHPNTRKQRIIYGVLVSLFFIGFHFWIPRHDLPLALAVGNVSAPILNRLKFEFRKTEGKRDTIL